MFLLCMCMCGCTHIPTEYFLRMCYALVYMCYALVYFIRLWRKHVQIPVFIVVLFLEFTMHIVMQT
jgi:hypothetical protein